MTLSTPSTSSRGAVLFVPVGRDRMVGNLAEMFARMKKVDRSFVGSELFEKRPVVGCGVGDGNQFGPHLADMSDLFGELRLQRRLAGFRPKTERFQAIAFRVLETDRPTGRLAPACFLVPVGAKRNHHPVERDGARLRRFPPRCPWLPAPFPSRDCPSFPTSAWLDDGFMPPSSPKSLAASRGVQWFRTRRARYAAGFIRQSAHRRPARTSPFPSASGNTGPDRTAWVFCVRAARTLPSSRTGPPLSSRRICRSPPGTAQRPAYPTSKSANAPLPFGPFLDEGCERPERLGGRGPLLDDGRKSSHRLGGHRGEFREGQTMTATLAWECS